jgi:outer membrane receptor protein involved in Fe transport
MKLNPIFSNKKVVLTFVTIVSVLTINANTLNDNSKISGTVKDIQNNEGIPFANIQILNEQDSSFVTGIVTDLDGNYSNNISKGKYIIVVSFIGYMNEIKITNIQEDIEKIDFLLSPKAIALSEVSVTAERNIVEQSIEKTTVNISKDKTVSGGTAIDALRNIPFVNIDMNGKVYYRGSDKVMVLINGNKSGLSGSLEQISADQIEKIEVVNNPSAKYESEGATGIINIVFKTSKAGQNKTSFKLNVGYPKTLGGNIGYSMMKKKTQFFINAGINHKTRFQTKEHFRDNYGNNNTYNYYQYDRQDGDINAVVINSNIRQAINDKHKIGASLMGSRKFNGANREINYKALNKLGDIENESFKEISIDLDNYSIDGSLDHRFDIKKGNYLTSKLHYSYFDQIEKMNNTFYPNTFSDIHELQNTESKQVNKILDLSFDYKHSLNDTMFFETGYRLENQDLLNGFDSKSYNKQTESWENNTISGNFKYLQTINALYLVFNANINNWKLQAGVRGEYTTTKQSDDRQDNYLEIFPSANISHKLNTNHTVFIGCNRRINRPTIKMLNPYFGEYADALNMHIGNPYLKPEIVNMIEGGNHFVYNKFSGKISVYYQHINQAISRVKSAVNDSALVVSYTNLKKATHTGGELSLSYKPFKAWGVSFNGDVFYTTLVGKYNNNIIDKSRTGWNLSLANNIKLPYGINMQILAYYKSKIASALEVYKERYYIDIALSKKILKDKALINFRISDIFNTNKFSPFVNARDDNGYWYSQTNTRKIETRYFVVSIVYNVGKKTSANKKKKGKFFLDDLVK